MHAEIQGNGKISKLMIEAYEMGEARRQKSDHENSADDIFLNVKDAVIAIMNKLNGTSSIIKYPYEDGSRYLTAADHEQIVNLKITENSEVITEDSKARAYFYEQTMNRCYDMIAKKIRDYFKAMSESTDDQAQKDKFSQVLTDFDLKLGNLDKYRSFFGEKN